MKNNIQCKPSLKEMMEYPGVDQNKVLDMWNEDKLTLYRMFLDKDNTYEKVAHDVFHTLDSLSSMPYQQKGRTILQVALPPAFKGKETGQLAKTKGTSQYGTYRQKWIWVDNEWHKTL